MIFIQNPIILLNEFYVKTIQKIFKRKTEVLMLDQKFTLKLFKTIYKESLY